MGAYMEVLLTLQLVSLLCIDGNQRAKVFYSRKEKIGKIGKIGGTPKTGLCRRGGARVVSNSDVPEPTFSELGPSRASG